MQRITISCRCNCERKGRYVFVCILQWLENYGMKQTSVKKFNKITVCLCHCFIVLSNNIHFFKQIVGAGKFVNYEKYVANIYRNVSALLRVVMNIAHGPFPISVKIYSD